MIYIGIGIYTGIIAFILSILIPLFPKGMRLIVSFVDKDALEGSDSTLLGNIYCVCHVQADEDDTPIKLALYHLLGVLICMFVGILIGLITVLLWPLVILVPILSVTMFKNKK